MKFTDSRLNQDQARDAGLPFFCRRFSIDGNFQTQAMKPKLNRTLIVILFLSVVVRVAVALYLGDIVDAPPLLTDRTLVSRAGRTTDHRTRLQFRSGLVSVYATGSAHRALVILVLVLRGGGVRGVLGRIRWQRDWCKRFSAGYCYR